MSQSENAAPQVFRSAEGRARYIEAYDAALSEWPVPFEELDLPTRLGTTHVIASGPKDAPVLLLLPSLAASALLWQPNVEALSRRFRTCAVDVIGQTGKSVLTKPIRDRREMAAWLCDVLDALGARKAALVGSSYGAFLALNLASLAPDRVERVALIGPAATFAGFNWKFYYAMLVKGPLQRLWRGRRAPDPTRLPGGMKLAPSGWGRLMSVTMSVSARPSLAKAIVFGRAELAKIRHPVLLLIGEKEVLYEPHATLARARKRLPQLVGEVVPGADHLASFSQPARVNARLLEFLTA